MSAADVLQLSAQDRIDMERAYMRVYATDDGKRVLDDIMYRLAMLDQPLLALPEALTIYNVGKRDLGVSIQKMLKASTFGEPKPKVKN